MFFFQILVTLDSFTHTHIDTDSDLFGLSQRERTFLRIIAIKAFKDETIDVWIERDWIKIKRWIRQEWKITPENGLKWPLIQFDLLLLAFYNKLLVQCANICRKLCRIHLNHSLCTLENLMNQSWVIERAYDREENRIK